MGIKNIIFDIDGTMVDSYYAATQAIKKALKEKTGVDYDEKILKKSFGVPETTFFKTLGLEYDEEMDDLINKYYREYSKTTPLFEGIVEILEEINKKELLLGIVTSRGKKDYAEFQRYQITHYFKKAVISEDTTKHKPNPDPLLKIVDDLNLKKEETIYIGDTIYDSDCARRAGIKFGLALWGTLDETIDADYYFEKPNQIIDKLEL